MKVQYQVVRSNEDCHICLDTLDSNHISNKNKGTDVDALAHNDSVTGKLVHPAHRKCIQLWAKRHANCPLCRADFDPVSLVPPGQRTFAYIKSATESYVTPLAHAVMGAATGTLMGAAAASAFAASEGARGQQAIIMALSSTVIVTTAGLYGIKAGANAAVGTIWGALGATVAMLEPNSGLTLTNTFSQSVGMGLIPSLARYIHSKLDS